MAAASPATSGNGRCAALRAVAGDPYQLRICLPGGFTAKRVQLSGGLAAKTAPDGALVTVD